jgi:hypothetical protein
MSDERYEDVIERYGDLDEYERGFLAGLIAYAHWRDGRMHVGTSETPLARALDDFLRARRR